MVPSCQRVCLLPFCGPKLFSFQGSVPHTSTDSSRHPGLRVLSGVHTRITPGGERHTRPSGETSRDSAFPSRYLP